MIPWLAALYRGHEFYDTLQTIPTFPSSWFRPRPPHWMISHVVDEVVFDHNSCPVFILYTILHLLYGSVVRSLSTVEHQKVCFGKLAK